LLAYLFWHSPREDTTDIYEQAIERFHRSIARQPPVGFLGSACYRAGSIPWLGGTSGYEDWYLVEDYTALGVLNEAAVAQGHVSAHEQAARALGRGTAGLYRLCEGAIKSRDVSLSIWVTAAHASGHDAVAGLLMADGSDGEHTALWRRQLVLGPAPEYCLLAACRPSGVLPSRLPKDWAALELRREALWCSEYADLEAERREHRGGCAAASTDRHSDR
jgi:hypothetical protein